MDYLPQWSPEMQVLYTFEVKFKSTQREGQHAAADLSYRSRF